MAIAEIDHQAGHGRARPAPPQQIRRQPDRGDRHRDVVGPQRLGVGVGAGGPGDRGEHERSADRRRRRERDGPCAALGAAGGPVARRGRHHDRRHEDDRRPRRARDRRDEPVDVRDGDQGAGEARAQTPAGVGEQQVHERPAVRVQQRVGEVTGEPRPAREHHQAGAAAARAPHPRHRAAAQQREPGDQITRRLGLGWAADQLAPTPRATPAASAARPRGAERCSVIASSEERRSPESSALAMNPRAGLPRRRWR